MTYWSHVRHFKRSEFGRNGDIEPDENLVRMLDRARDIAGIPFQINSGVRSPERNAEVGGVDTSAHLTGHAVDIRCATSRHRFVMVCALIEAGFRRIGCAKTFIHVDTDPDKPQDVIWTYD
jgi:uncharacterized protein YcbK (DUF882 family)